jgi:hypothetical protein
MKTVTYNVSELDLFPTSGEGRGTSPLLRIETNPDSKILCFLVFRIKTMNYVLKPCDSNWISETTTK